MSDATKEPAKAANSKALPASTTLLLRDGTEGLEVFMVKRNHAIDFASGALVFPGGKVDDKDNDRAIAARLRGASAMDPALISFAVAAAREAFEESGLLLAAASGQTNGCVDAARAQALAPWRKKLESGEAGMADFLGENDLTLAIDALLPFAHWITPTVMPKRFDTWFFVAPVPHDQEGRHDGGESVDSLWIRPAQALAESEAGKRTIVFATRMQLVKLARARTVAEALERARGEKIITVQPEVDSNAPGGPVLRIPAEADYGLTEIPVSRVSG